MIRTNELLIIKTNSGRLKLIFTFNKVLSAHIKKKATPHTLRQSFGTHLLEYGTDLRYIQVLMGHESVKTTEIYAHVTTKGFDQIKNPLDDLDFE